MINVLLRDYIDAYMLIIALKRVVHMTLKNEQMAFFLDFDGVIISSIEECFLVSLYAYNGQAKIHVELEEYKKLFFKYRGYVGPVYQFALLHHVLDSYFSKKIKESDILAEYRKLELVLSTADRKKFESDFFSIRKKYQSNLTAWLDMHDLTLFGKKLLNKDLSSCFVVTTKDKHSVELLLKHFKLNIPHLYCYEEYNHFGDKGKIIDHIMAYYNFPKGLFIDDSVEHLNKVVHHAVKCFFADWGYGTNSNYPVYREEDW